MVEQADIAGDGPVVVYVRPWNQAQFVDLASGVWPDSPLVEVSEHASVDKGGFKDAFYRAYRQVTGETQSHYLDDAETGDVILRCRLLRMIPRSEAQRLLAACELAIDEVLDRTAPRAMLSVTTDSYILHLYVLACRRRGIPFIGLVPSFVNGHFRVTALGEYVQSRRVDEDQIDKIECELLDLDYKPDFLAPNGTEQKKRARRLWLRNLVKPVWFRLRRKLSGDYLNYHYWSTEVVARQKWSLRQPVYKGCLLSGRDDLPRNLQGRKVIYLPLQMSPEATIDYWSRDPLWIDYERRILHLLDEHAENYAFIVKEHPNIVGYRTPGFYEKLLDRKNAVLVDPSIASNSILNFCDGVLFNTGTVGFEAVLRGLPVFSDSRPFHLPIEFPFSIASMHGEYPLVERPEGEKRILLRHVLQGVVPGTFINDGSWRSELHDQSQMVSSLRSILREGWV
ncbi:hypothetical protein [Pseudooceanicola sp.]|uniref:capsular polysaccharide export protein, LipB/KpsS family n=1 Tax=Pseudooceanicola sp. TaxID=1914328 RepID=UPI0035C75AF3